MKRTLLSLTGIGIAATASLTFTAPAQAIQIGFNDFSVNASMESFEGLMPGPDILNSRDGYLNPATPFTFDSGVTLELPFPNNSLGRGVVIGDFSLGNAGFGLGGNGVISSVADVVDGSAYLGYDDPDSSVASFTFASDISRVGGFVTGFNDTIILSAYDASGVLLETASISTVNVANWGNNFLGLENQGIRKITFSGDFTVLDKLTFEGDVAPVPTPALLPGIIGMGVATLRKKRKKAEIA